MCFRLGPIIFCPFCTSLGVSSGFCTFNELFRVFSWSMEALKIGVVTGRRHDGSEWTAYDKRTRVLGALPHKAALVQVRGVAAPALPISARWQRELLLDVQRQSRGGQHVFERRAGRTLAVNVADARTVSGQIKGLFNLGW